MPYSLRPIGDPLRRHVFRERVPYDRLHPDWDRHQLPLADRGEARRCPGHLPDWAGLIARRLVKISEREPDPLDLPVHGGNLVGESSGPNCKLANVELARPVVGEPPRRAELVEASNAS